MIFMRMTQDAMAKRPPNTKIYRFGRIKRLAGNNQGAML